MPNKWKKWIISTSIVLTMLLVILLSGISHSSANFIPSGIMTDRYVVLAWNDLGMHCYNRDFQDLAVLPPFNTLWAQVIKVGDPPQIITTGINLAYSFPDNTFSIGKTSGIMTCPCLG